MEFIQAQGAQHIDQSRLATILEVINLEQNGLITDMQRKHAEECERMIRDLYIRTQDAIIVSPMTYSTEEKYDGFSYLNSYGRFYSKRLSSARGNKGQPIDKTEWLPHIAPTLKNAFEYCGCDLHGELYIPDGISDNMTKIMGCTVDEAHNRLRNMNPEMYPHFMLIDIRAINGKSLINEPHRVRRAILKWVYDTYIADNKYIKLTEEFTDESPEHAFRRIVTGGGEGIIIKREDALYCPGKKPVNNWIKGKKKITHDVFMTGLNKGTGKNVGLFGSIRFAHMVDGKQVDCGNCSSGLSDEIREYIYQHAAQLITNKQVFEIEAIQESVKSFRNPVFLRFRDDKDWTECSPVNIRVKETLV